MQIEFTTFSLRQFGPNYAGTKLPLKYKTNIESIINSSDTKWLDSYQPFCKYLIVKNTYNIKTGTIKLNWFNKLFIKTRYISRTENELEVLTRCIKLPFWIKRPKANYLVFVLYSREQLIKELKQNETLELSDNCEWGVVAILGTSYPYPAPMPPITIMRNALGIEEGGNGVNLDKQLYKESVEFWKNNILIL